MHKLNLLLLLLAKLINLFLDGRHQLLLSLNSTLSGIYKRQCLLYVLLDLLQLGHFLSEVTHILIVLCLIRLLCHLDPLPQRFHLLPIAGIPLLDLSTQPFLY